MPKRERQAAQLPSLSLIVPVYDEYESLALLHQQIQAALSTYDGIWEVIYIDDGSRDSSLEVLQALQLADPRVVLAVQRRNFGKSLALAVGFTLAQGQIVVTLDADLQDDPQEIHALLAKLDEGFDVAVGWRHKRHDRLSKRLPSWLANTVTAWTTGLRLHDMNCGLKAYRAECVRTIRLYGDLHRYIPIMAHFEGFRVAEVQITHRERRFGKSKYGVGRLIRGGLDLLTVIFLKRYGRRPLHLFGVVGGLMFGLGTLINLLLTIEWLQGERIGTRPLLLLGVLLMVMGVQVLSVGLIGELVVAHMQRGEYPLSSLRAVHRADVRLASAMDFEGSTR
ncbi:MAG: glycosyltransferase [Chloroflexi bacterium CFX4]|nr:glycosyltransferase [Chloroflexi bacterium CFX4]MDL1924479.1 glycosyltransferase family 2 protein [Chloroflexi bacterium CFX3]